RALRRAEKYRPKIAGPGPVRGKPKEIDLAEVDGALSQRPPGSPLGPGVVDQDADALRLVQVAHDLGVDPGDGGELARPIVPAVRPGDPGRGVRFPFRRHPEAELSRDRKHGQPAPGDS